MPRRSRKTQDLATWLGTSQTPLFVLDAERRIRVFNAGLQSLTGWSAADVVGEVCRYAPETPGSAGAALASSLCPPPEVFSGEVRVVPAQILTQSGERLSRSLHYFPLRDPVMGITGVLGLVAPPLPPAELEATPIALRLHAELASLRTSQRQRFGSHTIVAVSRAMRRVLAQVQLAIPTLGSVLLQGEPGTGREHLSRVIHFAGPGAGRWYVPLDCQRLTAGELERMLSRLLEVHTGTASAGGTSLPGTLYLADVDHLPRDLQQRLCRLCVPGTGKETAPQIRILASTSRPWKELVAEERLLDELALQLTPLVIELPPLRERRDDIPLLAQHFLEDCNRVTSRDVTGLTDEASRVLQAWSWPRHLDELAEVLREAHASSQSPHVGVDDLPARLRTPPQAMAPPAQQPQLNLDQILIDAERRVIALALQRSRQNRTRAAALLGIQRTRLIRRLEVLGLAEPGTHAAGETLPSETDLGSEPDPSVEGSSR
jgi:DNA-binding NtrC family response regulator